MAIAINELGTWRRKALIVDDSRIAAAMLRRMLERQGFEVDWAGSPGAALGRLRFERPDIVFLDHWMEGLCGLDVLSLIKSNPVTAGVPVVMFTSVESPQYNEDALAAGASAVLPKRADAIDIPRLLERLGLQAAVPAFEPLTQVMTVPATVTPFPTRAAVDRRRVPTVTQTGASPAPVDGLIEPLLERHRATLRAELLAEIAINESHDDRLGRSLLAEARGLVDRAGRRLREDLTDTAVRAGRLLRHTLIAVEAAIALAIVTALVVIAVSLSLSGRVSDELATRDRAIAAANVPAMATEPADLRYEAAVDGR